MSRAQNSGGTVRGRPWPKGTSGNPGGRPRGQAELSRSARVLVGESGEALVRLWWDIARDETRRDSDRLRASELLADRGWGKAPNFEPLEGDPLDLAALEGAAEHFRTSVLRLADNPGSESDS
jgi:hypothetical protein